MSKTKNLTKQAPRSPHERLGGYVILARAIDKGRALLKKQNGEYNFDCPLDNMLLGFKGIKGTDLLEELRSGADDDQVLAWVNAHGQPKTAAEIEAWNKAAAASSPYSNPAKHAWYIPACNKLGLDPTKTTLFDFLDADDRASFAAASQAAAR